MQFLVYALSFLCIRNSQYYVGAEIKPSYDKSTSNEFVYCDYTLVESQLEYLKSGNNFLKLNYEMMQLQLKKQNDLLQNFEIKFNKLAQSLKNVESEMIKQNHQLFGEVKNMLDKQNHMIQNYYQEPPVDDKWHIMNDIKKTIKNHDIFFESFSEKLKHVENVLEADSWKIHNDSICEKLAILQTIDKKLTNVEAVTATKKDQITLNRNIQKYFSKNEVTKICLKGDSEKLICTSQSYPTSCADFNEDHCANDICRIYNHLYGAETFMVSCDDHTEGGRWTVIQRRINGSVDFYRNWSDYKEGFGNIHGEFFIGLDKLHALTATLQPMELLIQLKDFNDTIKYAKYDEFIVGNETEKYKLHKVGIYSGDAGDSFSYHQGYNFTTKDSDNDEDTTNCAQEKIGAWWYKSCMWSNLNGKYYKKEVPKGERGICWNDFHGYNYSMKFVQMQIRPKLI